MSEKEDVKTVEYVKSGVDSGSAEDARRALSEETVRGERVDSSRGGPNLVQEMKKYLPDLTYDDNGRAPAERDRIDQSPLTDAKSSIAEFLKSMEEKPVPAKDVAKDILEKAKEKDIEFIAQTAVDDILKNGKIDLLAELVSQSKSPDKILAKVNEKLMDAGSLKQVHNFKAGNGPFDSGQHLYLFDMKQGVVLQHSYVAASGLVHTGPRSVKK